jgi:hypothetical protein
VTGDGVEISPARLRASGGTLANVAARFDAELRALQADLAAFGQPWGGDEIGLLIGAAHEEVARFAFECYASVRDELGLMGLDLAEMAEAYEKAEAAILGRLNALLDRLGG